MAKDEKDKNNVVSIPNLLTNVTLLNLVEKVEELERKEKEIFEWPLVQSCWPGHERLLYFDRSTRVAFYSRELGKEIGLNSEELYN